MITDTDKDKFRNLFNKTQNTTDLLDLLNEVRERLFPKSKPFELRLVNYYAFSARERYTQFTIPKKNGGARTITAPVRTLKMIQRCINLVLNTVFVPPKQATGFVLNKCVRDNAARHVRKNYVYNIDLKDFFPSIAFRRVKTVLQLPPFNLSDEISFLIANLCCEDGSLPQGAPTSPTLSNIVCQRLDRQLNALAKRFGASYSRYADDITFSSNHNVYQAEGDFLRELNRIIAAQRFQINTEKTRLQKQAFRQEVTGLVVNEKVNLQRRYIRQIRAMLSNWEKKGMEEAERIYYVHCSNNGHEGSPKPGRFEKVLKGKIEYMGMVLGKNNPLFQKYKKIYNNEMEKVQAYKDVKELLDILKVWENQGIDEAIEQHSIGKRRASEGHTS